MGQPEGMLVSWICLGLVGAAIPTYLFFLIGLVLHNLKKK